MKAGQPSKEKIEALQTKVLNYYYKEGRDLPWRKTTDKYHILVSEVMSQQTQISRVITKYNEWFEKYPTIKELSESSLNDVLEMWNGLGYNSRAKRLRDLAIEVQTKYNGIIPSDYSTLLSLPGIGPYTANAVLIFSENQNRATVDANIRRIFIKEFELDEAINDKELYALATLCLPKDKSRDWHNALMDYGSKIMTSNKTGIGAKTKQSKFKGSSRYYRAEILRQIRKNDGKLSLDECTSIIKQTNYNINDILNGLAKDGLIKKVDNYVYLED